MRRHLKKIAVGIATGRLIFNETGSPATGREAAVAFLRAVGRGSHIESDCYMEYPCSNVIKSLNPPLYRC
jgi:hypothetical protein